jgi:aspartyl-tRNA synthetase
MATLDLLGDWKRTHYAGDLRAADADKEVVLMGWVHRRRDLGNLIFIDVRDRGGIAQVVFNKELGVEAHARAEELRSEYVVAIRGKVAPRSRPNPDLPRGEVEIFAAELRLLNTPKTPPSLIEHKLPPTEETRLRYRYLDMRRPQLQRNIALRHRVVPEMRKARLDGLSRNRNADAHARSTPEGAALPGAQPRPSWPFLRPAAIAADVQAASDDRRLRQIFQTARCFRDEDLRADRQPDFTLDLEMSFRSGTTFSASSSKSLRVCAVGG